MQDDLKPMDGKYGSWAGNPKGNPEDKTRCVAEVWPHSSGWIPYQCLRKRGFGPNGEYCKQHAKRVQAEKTENE